MKNKTKGVISTLITVFLMVSLISVCSVLAWAEKSTISYMVAYTQDSTADFHKYRNNIVSVTFLETIDNASMNAEDTIEKWNVSVNNDQSIMAWMKLNEKATVIATKNAKLAEPSNETKRYDVYIGSGNIIALNDGSNLFYNFTEVKTINGLNCLNTSETVNMSYMFYGCSELTDLDLSSFDTSNVTNMSYMFYGCSGLTSLDLSGWNTTKVTNAKNMLPNAGMNINMEKFVFSNATAGIFKEHSKITSINLKSVNTSSVTNMSSMFNGCSWLTSLDLSDFDTSKVTNMSYMFNGCSGLTELDLSSFNTLKVTDMGYMFSGCSGLTSLNLSGWDTTRVTDAKDMLPNVAMSVNMENFVFSKATVGIFKEHSNIISINLKNANTSNVTNMSSMFNGCSGLTELDLSSFDTSNVTNMFYMFDSCRGLTELDLSSFNTLNVTNMIRMFGGCRGLTELDLSSFDTSSVTSMYQMFAGCSGLTSLDLSSFDTSKVYDMEGMFYNCSGLTSLDLSSFDTSNVTNMSKMFYGCRGLIELNCGIWARKISVSCSKTDIFYNCSSITIKSNVADFNTSDFGKIACTIQGVSFIDDDNNDKHQTILIDLKCEETKDIPDVVTEFINGRNINYVSDNPSIAIIDENGKIKGVSAGKTNIVGTVENSEDTVLIIVQVKNTSSNSSSTKYNSSSSSKTGFAALIQAFIDFFKQLFGIK